MERYLKHNVHKQYTSIGLFREIRKTYDSGKVLYPGCYVHITPSLIFPEVTYIDSFRNTYTFYESPEVKAFIEQNKEYPEAATYIYYQQDYTKDIPEELASFDLVISQYAGFVGQAVKKYLKEGGILVCNNSHGDASMASIDPEYKLIAVYTRKSDEKFSLSAKNLSKYLIPKKNSIVTKEHLQKTMRGIGYTTSPSGYVFRKVSH